MAYQSTGMMAMFPIYLERSLRRGSGAEEAENAVARNEVNLNQNFEELTRKILEIEAYLTENEQ